MDQRHVLYFFVLFVILLYIYMFCAMYCMFLAQCANCFQLSSYCVQHETVPMPTAVYTTESEHISVSSSLKSMKNG